MFSFLSVISAGVKITTTVSIIIVGISMAASGVWLIKHSSDITEIVQKFNDLHGVAISIRNSELGLGLFDSDTAETDEREQSDALELSLKSLTDTVT